MVHVLLVILKIIGILLAVLVALVLMLLFVPYSYDGSIEAYGKDVKGVFSIRWIAKIILLKIYNKEFDVMYVLKIFGITIFKGNITGDEAEDDYEQSKGKLNNKKKSRERRGDNEEFVEEDEDVFESLLKVLQDDTPIHKSENQQYSDFAKTQEKGQSRFDGIREKIKNITDALKDFPQKYKEIKAQFEIYKSKVKRLKKILKSKRFKYAFAYSKDILINLYNHIKPSKLEADIVFGFEEPDITGKVLAVLAIVCSSVNVNHEKFRIIPDFTEKRFEGKGLIKGKFLLAVLLRSVIKIYFKKEVRDVVNGIKRV